MSDRSSYKVTAGELAYDHLTLRIRFTAGRLTIAGDLARVEQRLAHWPTQDEGEDGDTLGTTRIHLYDDGEPAQAFTLLSDSTVEILD